MEKSEGYNWIKAAIAFVTFLFQAILLFSSQKIASYLLSNFSILSGYCLDLFVIKQSEKEKSISEMIWIEIVIIIISLTFSLADILFNSEFSGQNIPSVLHNFLINGIPCLTIEALAIYTLICLFSSIKISKNKDSFC